jgi:hypothetical protein
MLSSKTGLSLNMAGHYPGGHKNTRSHSGGSRGSAGLVYPQVRYLGPAHPNDVRVEAQTTPREPGSRSI